jgi:hypothetical protein
MWEDREIIIYVYGINLLRYMLVRPPHMPTEDFIIQMTTTPCFLRYNCYTAALALQRDSSE